MRWKAGRDSRVITFSCTSASPSLGLKGRRNVGDETCHKNLSSWPSGTFSVACGESCKGNKDAGTGGWGTVPLGGAETPGGAREEPVSNLQTCQVPEAGGTHLETLCWALIYFFSFKS